MRPIAPTPAPPTPALTPPTPALPAAPSTAAGDRVQPGGASPAEDPALTRQLVARAWDRDVVPALEDFIRIPNKSKDFDAQWAEHGHMEKAVQLIQGWSAAHAPPGTKVDVVRLPGRSPLIFMDIPAEGSVGAQDDPILMYGHLDKQPETTGWADGLSAWNPVLRDGRLYGRGGADDGYAAFASVTALKALHDQHVAHRRCVVMIESGEESGSPDLSAYVDHLAGRIGTPSLVVCLDSGCGDYDHLYRTSSLRGLVDGTLRVRIMTEGVHSGDAGGVVPSSFRIVRQLLDRVEDARSGRVLIPECQAAVPADRRQQLKVLSAVLGSAAFASFPLVAGARPAADSTQQLMLDRAWKPSLEVTGAEGLPGLADAGNVLRPETALKLSMRVPPTVDSERALAALKRTLEKDPPYGAKVTFEGGHADGWNAPPTAPWLAKATQEASQRYFGHEALSTAEGGTIPFINMLGERFPHAQFLITGVLGPGSNAHGPNEFLDLKTAQHLTCSIAHVVARQAERP